VDRKWCLVVAAVACVCAGAAAQELRIPIRVEIPEGVKAAAWPVTFGAPFAAGMLKTVEELTVVEEGGAATPCQAVKTGDWPDGSVRWALVDFRAQTGKRYALTTGARAAARDDILLKEEKGAITVACGGARYGFAPEAGGFALDMDADGDGRFGPDERLVSGEGMFYVIDSRGRRGELKPERIETALVGPRRSVVKMTGPYLTPDGARNAAATVYFHFYAGLPWARISHQLIVTEDTNELWFKEIGVRFATTRGGKAAGTFNDSRDSLTRTQTVPLAAGATAVMLQDDFPHFGSTKSHFSLAVREGEATREVSSGAACGNWAELSTERWGIAAQVPAFCETFPKAFRLAENGLTVELWASECGRELDFRTPTLVKEYFGADWIPEKNPVASIANSAQGTARTHEIWLYPHTGAYAPAQAANFGATAREIYAAPDPAHVMGTGVLGALAAKDATRFGEAEAAIADYFDRYVTAGRNVFPPNGYIAYGLYPFSSQPWKQQKEQGNRWYPTVHRLSRCLEYNLKRGVWLLYARSGERAYHDYARQYTRLLGDMLFSHVEAPCRPLGWIGSGDFHSPVFWGAYGEEALKLGQAGARPPPNSEASGLAWASSEDVIQFVYDWQMAGDFHSRDAALLYKAAVVKEFAGDVEKALAALGSRPEALLRTVGSLYELDHDPATLALCSGLVRRLANDDGELNEEFPTSSAKWGDVFGAYYYFYTATGDAWARRALLKLAEFQYRHGDVDAFFARSSPLLQAYALAWRETQDPRWAAYLRQAVEGYARASAAQRKIMPDAKALRQDYTGPGWGAGAMTGQGPVHVGIPAALAVMAETQGRLPVVTLPFAAKPHPTPATTLLLRKERAGAAEIDLFINNWNDREVKPVLRGWPAGTATPLEEVARQAHRARGPDFAWLNSYKWFMRYEDQLFLRLRIPAGAGPGVYQLDLGEATAWVLLWSEVDKIMQLAPQGATLPAAGRQYFHVPDGAGAVEYSAYRPMRVFDPEGREAAQEDLKNGRWRFAAGGRGGTWSMESARDKFLWEGGTGSETFVRMETALFGEERRPFAFVYANAPERLFAVDDRLALRAAAPAKAETERYVTTAKGKAFGPAVRLAEEYIEFALPEGTEFPRERGTVEFRLRPMWSATETVLATPALSDAFLQLFKCDPVELTYRVNPNDSGRSGRYAQAAYTFALGKAGHTRAASYVQAGRWQHVAMTWRVDGRESYCRLFIDGRLRAHCHYNVGMDPETPAEKLTPAGRVLRFGSGRARGAFMTGELYDELRVSRTVRYEEDFDAPTTPFTADEDTVALAHFDDDLDVATAGGALKAALKRGKLW
jgi:hypothetical protein